MLSELFIENVAVIEQAEIRFSGGLNVLTGETGAGKSILIDSINAILGNRTTKDIVRSGADKAVIWALFDDVDESIKNTLKDLGIDDLDTLVLHREISADGGSRCRINQRPATATAVRDLCQTLINIHGQHDNQDLLNPDRHIFLLDNFADLNDLIADYAKDYHRVGGIRRKIESLTVDESQKERQSDLLRYQIDEIEKAGLFSGEDGELSAMRNAIRNSEKILEALNSAVSAFSGVEEVPGAMAQLFDAMEALSTISDLSGEYAVLSNTLEELYYSAVDTADRVVDALQGFDYDPSMLLEIEERIDIIFRLKRKYGVTIEEILTFMENARKELDSIETCDEQRELLEKEYSALMMSVNQKAELISKQRRDALSLFEKRIISELEYLNMSGAVFEVALNETGFNPRGKDEIEFHLSTNTGEPPKPLTKIASGGELSRIMLAIKNAMAEKDEVGTLIFDEIDSGVSGNSAFKIGKKLKESAKSRQTICVTHSAQIAAFADSHLLIEKAVRDGRTHTSVRILDFEQQKRELARIISGDNITGTSIENAAEMLKSAGNLDMI